MAKKKQKKEKPKKPDIQKPDDQQTLDGPGTPPTDPPGGGTR